MKHIVQHIKKTYFDKTKIVLVAPGPFFPVNEDATKRSTNEIHRQYAQACVDVANEEVCGKHELHDYNTTCNWIGKQRKIPIQNEFILAIAMQLDYSID